ncbi:MAG: DUF302 domain-containing protein [Thermoplasmata archaeon]
MHEIDDSGLMLFSFKIPFDFALKRLKLALTDAGLHIFCQINHSEAALNIGLEMPPTVVLVFGNPLAGTPLMKSVPLLAIDLPSKILLWESNNSVKLAFNSFSNLKKRYNIEGFDLQIEEFDKKIEALITRALS